MVVLKAKFTILIWWSSIFISLVFSSASIKLTSILAETIYSNIESGHQWNTSSIRVKWSDRGAFILSLDWMLVYATLTVWMNLSLYSKSCKGDQISMTNMIYWYIWQIRLLLFKWHPWCQAFPKMTGAGSFEKCM